MAESEVSILIPTYFASRMALNCIESILKTVQNPRILLYKNDVGWLQACNALMRSLNTDIILLNDDTVVLTDIAKEMSFLAYSDSSIGIVGGKSLAPNGDTVINYGIYIGPDGNTAHKHYGQLSDNVTEVETQKAVEGSCMFIKREVLDKVGYFDESYGQGYRAEVDYCFKVRESGYKIVSSPNSKYIHFTSQTMGPLGVTNDTHAIFMEKWGAKLKLGKI